MSEEFRNQICISDIQVEKSLVHGVWRVIAYITISASGWVDNATVMMAKGRVDAIGELQYNLCQQVNWKIYGDVINYLREVIRGLSREINISGLMPREKEGFLEIKGKLQDLVRCLEDGTSIHALRIRQVEDGKEDLSNL